MSLQKSFQESETGKLFLVPTPIGNLEDITLRAIKVLQEVDIIAAEDTRTTGKLLELLQIKSPAKYVSFHEHNAKQKSQDLVAEMLNGKSVAQVSDAGTPVISDPGFELVQAAIDQNIDVISLPGPSAFLTALVGSGLNATPFTYYGFIERKQNAQIEFFEAIKEKKSTSVFYESPYRIAQTINTLSQVFEPERQIVLARELTKIHEEYFRGTIAELVEFLEAHELKGEMVVLIAPFTPAHQEFDESELIARVDQLIASGTSTKDAIKSVSQATGVKKNDLYDLYHQQ